MSLFIETDYPAGAYEALAIVSTATGFTSSKILAEGEGLNQEAKEVFCTLETANIRFTLDGTTPSTSTGHLLTSGQNLTLKNSNDIVKFRASKVTNDASLKCTFRY